MIVIIKSGKSKAGLKINYFSMATIHTRYITLKKMMFSIQDHVLNMKDKFQVTLKRP